MANINYEYCEHCGASFLFVIDLNNHLRKQHGVKALTSRQLEILQLLADGLTLKQVAEQLEISVRTVRNHMYNTRIKLGATRIYHAVAIALRERLIY